MIPQDPAYEARVRESFGRQSHMATLGAEIVFIAPTGAAERVLIATMLSTVIVRPRSSGD